MESRNKMLLKLFLSTLYLSAFTFGGGYVIVSLMKKKFVDECGSKYPAVDVKTQIVQTQKATSPIL